MNRALEVTFNYKIGESEDYVVMQLEGSETIEDVLDYILENIEEGIERNIIEVTGITRELDLEDKYNCLEGIFDFAEAYCACDQEIDVVEAALDCDISGDNIDEAYSGKYNSDEDFTRELVESCGDIPKDLPSYIHIDWEWTAKEIMQDYSTSNGYYFRIL